MSPVISIPPGRIGSGHEHPVSAPAAPEFQREAIWKQQAEVNKYKAELLLEKLRYREYVRHGTLATWMQTIGDGVRSGHGPWFWAFMLLMFGSYMGIYGWMF